VLAWLLGQAERDTVRAAIAEAEEVVTSDLTLVECDRALIRVQATLELPPSEVARRRQMFEAAAAHWALLRISPAIVERARKPFPGDPIRSLDALHLASALAAKDASDDIAVLSLDRRVRRSARALGLEVAPARLSAEQ